MKRFKQCRGESSDSPKGEPKGSPLRLGLLLALALAAKILTLVPSFAEGAVPQLINFQGILKDGSGNPVADGSYSVAFRIYDAPAGGNVLWTETQSVTTTSGLFAVLLGSTTPVPDTAFKGIDRYLGLTVSPDPEMTPRQRLVSVGYSYRVNSVDGASGGTITSKVSIGPGHTNAGTNAFVAGQNNTAGGDWSSVGGGLSNTTNGPYAAIGGGNGNSASGFYTTVGGGQFNSASTASATVGGGDANTASGFYATAGGGSNDTASGSYSTVPGGNANKASGAFSLAAGSRAKALHEGSFVWADFDNSFFGSDFYSTAADQFLIRASGGVGINTNSPNKALTVAGSMEIGTGAGDYQHLRVGGGNSSGFLYGSFPAYGDGIHLDYNHYAASNGSHFVINPGGGTSHISVGYGEIKMQVGAIGGAPTQYGIYVVYPGNVGIGTTAPAAKLHVNGTAGNNTGVWSNLSDRRLKKDVEPIEGALETMGQLQGVSFRWKDDEKDAQFGRVRGLIAQDVEKVIPEWIKTDPDGYKRIEPIGVDALLIEAIKEQQRQIEELKEEILKLKKESRRVQVEN